nr:GAF domain-containing protein [Anaerolineae bacterium]
ITRARSFDQHDIWLVTLFANQAVIAIENARLYHEAQRRAERLAVVNRIARAASATLHLDDLVETVYQEIASVFEADAFFIALYDGEADELDFRLQVDEGVREPPERRPLGPGLTTHVVTSRKPLLIRDFEKEKDRLPPAKLWGTMKAPPSWLGVPMRIGDRVVGVISVQAYRPHAYGEEEQLLLSTIADQVAVAVENARLYDETRRRLAREERLNELAHTLGGEMELATLIPRLLPLVAELTGADASTVAIFDPDRNVITYPYSYNLPDTLAGVEVPAGSGLAGYTMRVRQPVLLDDYREHPAALRPWVEAGVRSLLAVPLVVGDEVVGAMGLFSLGEVRPFGPEAVAAAQAAGRLAAVAIQR